MKKNVCLTLTVISLCSLWGCGKKEDPNRPATTPVSGVLTQEGTPVAGATITFFPDLKEGKAAFGKTDSEGKFVLGTFGNNDGAAQGSYKVSVKKLEELPAVPQVSTDDPNYDPNYKEPVPKSLLPKKYEQITTSGLTAVVGAEKVVDLKFDLAKK